MYCLINEQQCFIGFNHEPKASDFRPDKTRAASLMNVLKNIPGLKACLNRVDNNGAFVNIGN